MTVAGMEEARQLFSPAESQGKMFTSCYGTAWVSPGAGTRRNGMAGALGPFAKAASGELLKEGSANVCGEKSRKVSEVEKVTHMRHGNSRHFMVPLRRGAESPSAPPQCRGGASTAHHHRPGLRRSLGTPNFCIFIGCPRVPQISYISSGNTLDPDKNTS